MIPTIAQARAKVKAAHASLKSAKEQERKIAASRVLPMLKKKRDAFYEAFGELVCEKRLKIGLSQEDLSINVGLTRQSVCNIEKGRQAILTHHLYLFAKALECDVRDLLPKGK